MLGTLNAQPFSVEYKNELIEVGLGWIGLGEMRDLSERCADGGCLVSWVMYSRSKSSWRMAFSYRRRGEGAWGAGTKADVLMLLKGR